MSTDSTSTTTSPGNDESKTVASQAAPPAVHGASEETAMQRKAKLESIVWPLVREAIEKRIAEAQLHTQMQRAAQMEEAPGCIVVEAALLLEAGWADLCDEVTFLVLLPHSNHSHALSNRER